MSYKHRGVLLLVAAGLSGCLSASPYPSRFLANDIDRVAEWCRAANQSPHKPEAVQHCIDARGAGWERRGLENRGYSKLAGGFAIPAAAVGIGLAAKGDPNHAVAPLGLLTGSALSYSSAYARPDQATVYERTLASYRCLSSATAEWRASGSGPMTKAFDALDATVTDFETAVRAARVQNITWSEELARIETSSSPLTAQAVALARREIAAMAEAQAWAQEARGISVQAEMALSQAQGMPGARLLQRADTIDDAAVRAIAALAPDPLAVANAARTSLQTTLDTVGSDLGATEKANEPLAMVPPAAGNGLVEKAKPVCDSQCRRARAIAVQARATRIDLQTRAMKVEDDADRFKAALKAYTPGSAEFGANCALRLDGAATALTTSVEDLELTGDTGWFVVRGGVPPYGARGTDGLVATVTPVSGLAAHIEVKAPAGAGPWTVHVTDASAAGSGVAVPVTRADDETEDDDG
ncbi:MAG TPA: hypothetical protein VD906_13820 [Caulobacteraceae bacterium]|nr:hypothetical protein [Caulobacteraceae bacterium]